MLKRIGGRLAGPAFTTGTTTEADREAARARREEQDAAWERRRERRVQYAAAQRAARQARTAARRKARADVERLRGDRTLLVGQPRSPLVGLYRGTVTEAEVAEVEQRPEGVEAALRRAEVAAAR